MAFKRTNRWDVQVAFPKWAFGIKSRSDVPQTPESVVKELEDFCQRVRRAIAIQDAEAKRAVTTSAGAATLIIFLICSISCASSTLGKSMNAGVVGSGIADVASTQYAIQSGRGREGNPVAGQGLWRQAVLKSAGVSTVIGLAAILEAHDHGRWAQVIRSAAIIGWGAVSIHNVKVAR